MTGRFFVLLPLMSTLLGGCDNGTDLSGLDDSTFPDLPYAHGIRLTRVEANQGVGIPIIQGGHFVPLAERNARLIENRQTLIWGMWEVDANWKPRAIRAELRVTPPDRASEVFVEEIFIGNEASTFESRELSLSWELPPEHAAHGSVFQISLLEGDGRRKGPIPNPPPHLSPDASTHRLRGQLPGDPSHGGAGPARISWKLLRGAGTLHRRR